MEAPLVIGRQTRSDMAWEGFAWHHLKPGTDSASDMWEGSHRRTHDKDRIPSKTMMTPEGPVPRPILFSADMFFSYLTLPKLQVSLLHSLMSQRTVDGAPILTLDFLKTHLVPRLNRSHPVSLRVIDWLMVNFAPAKGVAYMHTFVDTGESRVVVVADEYLKHLKLWRRRHFDTCRRRHRVYFDLEGETYSTTVAQLRLFVMIYMFGILEYAEKHLAAIEAHMRETMEVSAARKQTVQKSGRKPTRHTLVKKQSGTCFAIPVVSQVDLLSFTRSGSGSGSRSGSHEDDPLD